MTAIETGRVLEYKNISCFWVVCSIFFSSNLQFCRQVNFLWFHFGERKREGVCANVKCKVRVWAEPILYIEVKKERVKLQRCCKTSEKNIGVIFNLD